MDIHDLKIFLMIAQGQCFREHVQEWLQKIRSGEITR